MKDNIYAKYVDNGPSAPVIYTVGSADFAHGQLGTHVQNNVEKGYIQVQNTYWNEKVLSIRKFSQF